MLNLPSSIIPNASWPQSLPHPEETEVLSVVVSAECLRWCVHVRVQDDFCAKFFWKSYGSVLPENGQEIPLFKDALPPVAIREWSLVKRIPFWTVYVLAADPSIDAGPVLHHFFQDIPCRLFSLQASDFFPQQQQLQMPLHLLASLKGVQRFVSEANDAVLILETKQPSHLEYAASCGTEILGHGIGPPLKIPAHSAKHVFSQDMQAKNASSYLHLLGIVKEWELRCRKAKKRKIFVAGSSRTGDPIRSLLPPGAEIRVEIDFVHFGMDIVLRDQTQVHGELSEPLDRLLIGQRVILENYAVGTIRGAIPRESRNASIQEYRYTVELDDGKHQEVLGIDQVIAAIMLYMQQMEKRGQIGVPRPRDEYAKMLDRKIEWARAGLLQFEKERSRTEALQKNAAPWQNLDHQGVVNGSDKIVDRRQAAEDTDPDACRKKAYIGRRVAKYFGRGLFFGTITGWEPAANVDDGFDLWRVDYDDGDEEDYDQKDVNDGLTLFEKAKRVELD